MNGLDDPIWERNICKLTKQYIRREFLWQALANIPIFVYEIYLGLPYDEETLMDLRTQTLYNVFMGLKILRLHHMSALSRSAELIWSKIQGIFYYHLYALSNLYRWATASIFFFLAIHFFACGWILVYEIKLEYYGIEGLDFTTDDYF